jgi:NDP-mannose synthase
MPGNRCRSHRPRSQRPAFLIADRQARHKGPSTSAPELLHKTASSLGGVRDSAAPGGNRGVMRAVILAGGIGSRLRPYTLSLPKPLLPIGEKPILQIIVQQLAQHGFSHLTLAVNHQADLFSAYFGDGRKWGVQITYSLEREALGTMGPLRLIDDLPPDFLVMNGDVLTDLDYGAAFRSHQEQQRRFTIFAAARRQKVDFGVLHVDERSHLSGFEEKPDLEYIVSMGIYAVSREIVQKIPTGKPYGFDQLMLDCLADGVPVNVQIHDGYWLDIGRPDDYERATEEWPKYAR